MVVDIIVVVVVVIKCCCCYYWCCCCFTNKTERMNETNKSSEKKYVFKLTSNRSLRTFSFCSIHSLVEVGIYMNERAKGFHSSSYMPYECVYVFVGGPRHQFQRIIIFVNEYFFFFHILLFNIQWTFRLIVCLFMILSFFFVN